MNEQVQGSVQDIQNIVSILLFKFFLGMRCLLSISYLFTCCVLAATDNDYNSAVNLNQDFLQ